MGLNSKIYIIPIIRYNHTLFEVIKMLTAKQLRIFGLFSKNTFREYTFKELKSSSKEKSHSLLQNAIGRFLKEELITERKLGTSKLYLVNHKNCKVHHYLGLNSQEELPKPAMASIMHVKEEMDKAGPFYALAVFGSYADGSFTKSSDLDLAVFIPDKKKKMAVEAALNSASNKTIIGIDYHVITEAEFLEMLRADYENLGKQIARKNLPVYNPSIFYRLILRGIENGFSHLS